MVGIQSVHRKITAKQESLTCDERGQLDKAIAGELCGIAYEVARHHAAMEKHRETLLALRAERNALAAINRFPAEVLCMIFSWARDDDVQDTMDWTAEDGVTFEAVRPVSWVGVTHVCRHWRNTALANPNLWTRPPLRNTNWTMEMFERSRGAPLSLDVTLRRVWPWPSDAPILDPYSSALQLALKESARLRNLTLCTDPWQWGLLWGELSAPTPALESLTLDSAYVPPGLEMESALGEGPWVRPAFDPSSPVFQMARESPRLRALELGFFSLRWRDDRPFCPGLTSLKLMGCSLDYGKMNWAWLVALLRQMPRLEVLGIKDSFPRYEGEEEVGPVLHLERLRELSVSGDPKDVEMFFSRVSFPPDTLVKVECCVKTSKACKKPNLNFSRAFSAIASAYSKMHLIPTFRTLVMLPAPLNLHGAKIKLFERELTDEQLLYAPNDDVPALFEITYSWPIRYIPPDIIATRAAKALFSCGLPFYDVEHVYIKGKIFGFEAVTLARTVGALPEARHFTVGMNAGRVLIDAMACTRAIKTTNILDKLTFPCLESILFYGTSFRMSAYRIYDEDFVPDHLSTKRLVDCLAARRACGVSNAVELIFRECLRFNRWDVDTISKALRCPVDWDGDEEESSDGSSSESDYLFWNSGMDSGGPEEEDEDRLWAEMESD